MNIRLFKPSVGAEELSNIQNAFDASWIGLGPRVSEFEKKWALSVGANYALGVNSATAALHLSLKAFRFQKGKKVLVPSLTFASTACAVLYNDLVPVFVDSNPITLGMDLEDARNKYDKDCVAIIPVHYAGHPVPMEDLLSWSDSINLKVIEDCAHTSGSIYKGKALGTWGDFGCFSFEEKKIMTTGDGGMIVSNDLEMMNDLKAYRWVGIDKDNWKSAQQYTNSNKDAMHWFYEINLLGYKYNMNDLAASIGLAQLDKLESMNKRRSEIISKYLSAIEKIDGIKPLLPYQPDDYVYQMFGIRSERRDELMIYLKSKGIATGCHYTPLTLQPLFKLFRSECNFIENEANHFITLPLHAELTDKELDYIIYHLESFS